VSRAKSRSLDTAAVKQARLAAAAEDVGKGDRQNLKQLVMDKVSNYCSSKSSIVERNGAD